MSKFKKTKEVRIRKKQVKEKVKRIKEIDDDFVLKVGPTGGQKVQPDYIRKGDGFETIIHVYEYPKNVPAGWMNRFKQQGIFIVITATPESNAVVLGNINTSMNEHLGRTYDPKIDMVDKVKSTKQLHELGDLVKDIDGAGEVVVKCAIRLHLFEKTLEDLDKRVKETLEKLEGNAIKGVILLNEQENEQRAVFRKSTRDILYGRNGIAIPALTFAAGFPFSTSQLNDPRGMPLGFTDDGGSFLIDLFHRTETRGNYNACVFGAQRSGKSTFLKKLLKFLEIMGHRTRVLDPVGEFVDIAHAFGGKVINLDGSGEEAINPLDFSVDVETSLSKGKIFLKYIAPVLSGHEMSMFGGYLKRLYESGVHNPLFSEVRDEVKKDLKSNNISTVKRQYLENLEIQLNDIVDIYGKYFNRKSTINTLNEDMVVYTLRNLMSQADNVKQAQMFSIKSMLWNELLTLGSIEKKRYDSGVDIKDIRFFMIIGDEMHHLLKSNNTDGIDYLSTIQREAPKFFGGLTIATHQLSDTISGIKSEHAEKIKSLFQLSQYKFLLKLDANELDSVKAVFKNQITAREMEAIPSFRTGQALVHISGDSNYKINIHASEAELALFKGGK